MLSVNKVCQFIHAPIKGHWVAVKRILRYLKGTASFGLHITHASSLSFHIFTDVDWADSIDDHKSTEAYIVFFFASLIFHRNLASNELLHAPTLKLSIRI
jgi:histone deacetylase 1/2